jgi:hypothetical protein
MRKNKDVRVMVGPPSISDEKLALFNRHKLERGLARREQAMTKDGYAAWILRTCSRTDEMQYLVGERLVGVGIVDLGGRSLSSVYFYFDPDEGKRSLGTFSVLAELAWWRRQKGRYHYLGLYVEDWTQRNANFFRSIELTKRMMFFILLLVVAVAAFNIVSTLVMAVKDKQPDIAILRTIGARPASILAVFTTQGTVIGLLGTLAGVALGVLLSVNLETLVHGLERLLGVSFMDASVYLMSDLPARVEPRDVALIAGTAFALCCLSTVYPAWRAATTDPARALRED